MIYIFTYNPSLINYTLHPVTEPYESIIYIISIVVLIFNSSKILVISTFSKFKYYKVKIVHRQTIDTFVTNKT